MPPRQRNTGIAATVVACIIFILPFGFIALTAVMTKSQASFRRFSIPVEWHFLQNFLDVLSTRNDMILRAYFNFTLITFGAVTMLILFGAMVGFILQRRQSAWTLVIYAGVLIGLIILPAVVPTIWVMQGLGLFKTIQGMIFIQVA